MQRASSSRQHQQSPEVVVSPDGSFVELQKWAIQTTRVRLSTRFELNEITPPHMGCAASWELTVGLDLCERIFVHVPLQFPFELPYIFLEDPTLYGRLAHLNRHGRFCYIDESAITYSIDRIADAVDEALDKSLAALANPEVLEDEGEFRKELFAYLSTSGKFWSLISDFATPRKVCVLRFKKTTYAGVGFLVGDSEPELRLWAHNIRISEVGDVEEATFIPEALPGRPPFPTKNRDIMSFLRSHAHKKLFLNRVRKHPLFVTAVGSKLGPTLVAWEHGPSLFADPARAPKIPGFRPGKYPVEQELQLLHPDVDVQMFQGERVDLGRLADRTEPTLAQGCGRNVVIAGVGSIGSHLIQQICSATQCNSVTVFDEDKIGTENVLRHFSNFTDVGFSKAFAASFELGMKFPWMTVAHYGNALTELERFLENSRLANILILATGSEEIDHFLATEAFRQGSPDLLIAQIWLESKADVGHIVCYKVGHSSCPSCTRVERARLELSTLNREPGCGGSFANYGGSRLQRFVALASDFIVHADNPFRLVWHSRNESDLHTRDQVSLIDLTDPGCEICRRMA